MSCERPPICTNDDRNPTLGFAPITILVKKFCTLHTIKKIRTTVYRYKSWFSSGNLCQFWPPWIWVGLWQLQHMNISCRAQRWQTRATRRLNLGNKRKSNNCMFMMESNRKEIATSTPAPTSEPESVWVELSSVVSHPTTIAAAVPLVLLLLRIIQLKQRKTGCSTCLIKWRRVFSSMDWNPTTAGNWSSYYGNFKCLW